jgi:hypothetical protein
MFYTPTLKQLCFIAFDVYILSVQLLANYPSGLRICPSSLGDLSQPGNTLLLMLAYNDIIKLLTF